MIIIPINFKIVFLVYVIIGTKPYIKYKNVKNNYKLLKITDAI